MYNACFFLALHDVKPRVQSHSTEPIAQTKQAVPTLKQMTISLIVDENNAYRNGKQSVPEPGPEGSVSHLITTIEDLLNQAARDETWSDRSWQR